MFKFITVFISTVTLMTIAMTSTAQAFSLMKCNSEDGKTIWASFGKRVTSGDPEPVYFPTEITVFSSKTVLESRLVFERTVDSLKIPVTVTPLSVRIEFPVSRANGEVFVHILDVRQFSPKSKTAYTGLWDVSAQGSPPLDPKRTNCSIY